MSKKGTNIFSGMLLIFISAAVIIGLAFILIKYMNNTGRNPYEYDIDNFKNVPKKYIKFKEKQRIKVDSKGLYGISVWKDIIYITVDHKVIVFRDNIKIFEFRVDTAQCIAADEYNIYLGIDDHIDIFTVNGVFVKRLESFGERAYITCIALGNVNNNAGKGNLFIADYGNKIVWVFNKNGKLINKINGKNEQNKKGFIIPSACFDVAVDNDNIWIVNPGIQKIEEYDFNGRMVGKWGRASMEIDGFSGCCNPVHIAIMNGMIITSEKGMPRIKAYYENGDLYGVVAPPRAFENSIIGSDIAAGSNKVYVLDQDKKMIRVFEKY